MVALPSQCPILAEKRRVIFLAAMMVRAVNLNDVRPPFEVEEHEVSAAYVRLIELLVWMTVRQIFGVNEVEADLGYQRWHREILLPKIMCIAAV